MLVRHGVRLPPLLADMWDQIEAAKDRGLYIDSLVWMFYPGKPTREAGNCVKVNISRINDLMCETDYRIRSAERFAPYRVVMEKETELT